MIFIIYLSVIYLFICFFFIYLLFIIYLLDICFYLFVYYFSAISPVISLFISYLKNDSFVLYLSVRSSGLNLFFYILLIIVFYPPVTPTCPSTPTPEGRVQVRNLGHRRPTDALVYNLGCDVNNERG